VISDATSSHAIVLQEGLRFLPASFANFVSKYLIREDETSLHVELDPECAVETAALEPTVAQEFVQALTLDVANEGTISIGADASRRLWSSPARTRATTMIEAGFKTFLVAHEASHCFRRHVIQIESGELTIQRARRQGRAFPSEAALLSRPRTRHLPEPTPSSHSFGVACPGGTGILNTSAPVAR
jgi:hypothetical protein